MAADAEPDGTGVEPVDAGVEPVDAGVEPVDAGGHPPRRTRVHVGELVSAASALLLLVLMFAAKWYGVAGVPDPSYARPAISGAEDGWNGLTVVRWVILATVLAAIGAVFLHASQRAHGTKTDTSRVVAGMGTLCSALLIYRVLIVLPGAGTVIDQKLGAVVGLACALGVAWGGYESILEQRTRAGTHPHPPRHPHHRGRRRVLITPGRRSQ
ncbi:MAG TPA: hypothetical protein VG325_12780 [Solirubrobacteraceae bacterium]|nr:hypothetical protein [Solirubrobacteraceae bacterium]